MAEISLLVLPWESSKSQVNEDLLTFVKVGQGQDKGGSLPVQRLPA
jgi:hypothetical protein